MSIGSGFVVQAGDPNTPIHHALTIVRDSINWTSWNRMGLIGAPNSGKPIVHDTKLKGTAGEEVNYHYVPFADKKPIKAEAKAPEGNENSFQEFKVKVVVDTVDFPFRVDGDMTVQRTILNGRREMRSQIAQHFANYNDIRLFEESSGIDWLEEPEDYEKATDVVDRVNGENRCIAASGYNNFQVITEAGSDNTALNATLSSADKNNPFLWKRASVMVTSRRAATPQRMQGMRSMNGKELFIGFMSKNAGYDLTMHPAWFSRSLAVSDAGISDDPFAKGSLGVIDNIALHESSNVIEFIDAADSTLRFARNLLVGMNATLLGFAKTLTYVERLFNYNKSMGINGGEIRGEAKFTFENKDDTSAFIDFGVAQVITASN